MTNKRAGLLLLAGSVVLALLLGACRGDDAGDQERALGRDCLAHWNRSANAENRSVVASAAEYSVAAVTEREAGCRYVFHTESEYESYEASPGNETISTGGGSWTAALVRGNTDNALVIADGRLAELASATAGWSNRECKSAGTARSIAYELCFRGGRGVHGSFIAVRRGERTIVSVHPPQTRSPQSLIVGHWAWASLSPDGSTLLAQWSAECEVPYAFLIPLESGDPRPLVAGLAWYEQSPSEALGWTTQGRPLVRLWKSDCGRNEGRVSAYLTEAGGLRPLPCLDARSAPSVTPLRVDLGCGRPSAAPPGQRLCGPRDSSPPCGAGALPGVEYPYELRTHCGIDDTFFDGRYWVADPPLHDGSHNPPRGWGNPTQRGTIRLLPGESAEFRSGHDLVARFRVAPPSHRPVECD